VPFDIPVEAFAVEVGGGAHPSVRSLGDRRLVYIEHRHALRRAYRRRQLSLAVGLSGAFVVVAAAALGPGGHATATFTGSATRAARAASPARPATPPRVVTPLRSLASPMPPRKRAHRNSPAALPPPTTSFSASSTPRDSFHHMGFRDETRPPATVPTSVPVALADDAFLTCTRGFESVYAGGYGAISPDGRYFGAYQFDVITWNTTARYFDRFDLVGVRPDRARPTDQDLLAFVLYKWQGASHWNYRCAGLP
jgi:hypothetical protein